MTRGMRGVLVCLLLTATALLFGVAFAGVQADPAKSGQPTPLPARGQLAGVVRDAHGPVAGAVVRLQLTENKTTSDVNGAFTLSDLYANGVMTVTAWAPGYYVGWITTTLATQPVTITLKPYYTTDNLAYDWFSFGGLEGSASCALCHTQYPEWAGDAHAQAAVNPRFLSMYAGTDILGRKSPLTQLDASGKALPLPADQPYYGPGWRLDYPNRAGNCAACHTPLASKIPNTQNCGWSGCHTDVTTEWSQGVIAPGPSPLDLKGDAAEGIACDFCHKIGDVYLDPQTRLPYPDMPGILSYRLYRPPEGQQLFFGTFDDVTRRVTYLPLEEESAFCAPCHYGVFGGVVGVGPVAGGVIIYNSYGEWLESPYSDPETGKTCQDCHMPPVEYGYIVFPEQGGLPRDPNRIHNHRMPGAADVNLLQNSVTMTTTAGWEGDRVTVEVQITNDKTGHHVPTDSPLRHLILVVEATDADGRRMKLADGPVLPDWAGDYAGLPGKVFAKVLQDEWTGEIPAAAYWRPVRLVEDTRLAAFATDVSRYTFQAPEARPVAVEARLIFRRAYQELMRQKGWTDPDILMELDRITVLPAFSQR
jgi:hypothetical protein